MEVVASKFASNYFLDFGWNFQDLKFWQLRSKVSKVLIECGRWRWQCGGGDGWWVGWWVGWLVILIEIIQL